MESTDASSEKEIMESLNVGSGLDTWGDVRLDFAKKYLHTSFTPTILADAHNLPFRDKRFKITKASHLLEHLINPLKSLDEMVRVTREKIILKFPAENDVLPYFLCNIFPPKFTALMDAYLTQKRRLHLWIINPKIIHDYLKSKGWECQCQTKTICVLAFFESGRKAKYFKWLTKHFKIPCEYVIVAYPMPRNAASVFAVINFANCGGR